jgi:hypothetical protein
MKRIRLKVKLGINLAMISAFLVNMFTGFAMFFGLILGGGRQYNGVEGFNVSSLANLSVRAWYRFIHDWSGILLVVLILVHLVLNWNTLWCYLRNTWKNRSVEKVQESCENI